MAPQEEEEEEARYVLPCNHHSLLGAQDVGYAGSTSTFELTERSRIQCNQDSLSRINSFFTMQHYPPAHPTGISTSTTSEVPSTCVVTALRSVQFMFIQIIDLS